MQAWKETKRVEAEEQLREAEDASRRAQEAWQRRVKQTAGERHPGSRITALARACGAGKGFI